MNKLTTYGSWGLLAFAISAWVLVIYGGMYLMDQGLLRADAITSAEQQQSRAAHAERMKALAEETAGERTRLEDLARYDITAIVTVLEQVGPASGANVQISNASVEGSGTHIVDGVKMNTVAFIVSAEGSFADIVQATKLFENLPLPSEVSQVEFARSGDSAQTDWRLSGRVRVFTTATVSI